MNKIEKKEEFIILGEFHRQTATAQDLLKKLLEYIGLPESGKSVLRVNGNSDVME